LIPLATVPDVYADMIPNAANDLVDAFYKAALKAGGEDNGAPGPRPAYHPGYYAAYVKDPVCGINIEVVNHNA
jgi:hypothetical protein